ncbi:MAG: S-methyl-5-thioribose-1-phosphate isomerase [Cyanobacteria bacterium J06641_5]
MSSTILPVIWQSDKIVAIDQSKLPGKFVAVEIRRSEDVLEAIRCGIVQGAAAIGLIAAYALYLASTEIDAATIASAPNATSELAPQLAAAVARDREALIARIGVLAGQLRQLRPGLGYLSAAIARMLQTAHEAVGSISEIQASLLAVAQTIQAEDLAACQAIGAQGLDAILAVIAEDQGSSAPDKLVLLVAGGNIGALATAGYGTALGIARTALDRACLARTFVTESRPRLQGAKLAAWECVRDNIPATLIADTAAGYCLQQGLIDAIVVGAERIAANGDVQNCIGTYALATLAQAHKVPFFVAAPRQAIDFNVSDGNSLLAAERHPTEVYQIGTQILCPPGVECYNPGSDITPAALIERIITDGGAVRPERLLQLLEP